MHTSTLTRRTLAVVTVLAVLATLLTALMPTSPADAKSRFMSRASGRVATADWTQIDGTEPGTPFGNVHIGWLYAYETSRGKADAFVEIFDFDCEEGKLPGHGGHHDEPGEEGCVHVGARFGEGFDLAFSLDKKLETGRLVGTLVLFGGGHGEEGVVGRPAVDMTWSGTGNVISERSSYRYRDGGEWWSDSYRSTGRRAVMGGTLGPMGFDPAYSSGFLSTFKQASSGGSR